MENKFYKTDKKTVKNNKNIKSNILPVSFSNHLAPIEIKALAELKEKIKEKYLDADIMLYGSEERGDYNEYSDIDLMIIIKDNHRISKDIFFEELEKLYFLPLNEKIEKEILNILTDIQVKYCGFYRLSS
jgi:predicted nucleotidyltransferase